MRAVLVLLLVATGAQAATVQLHDINVRYPAGAGSTFSISTAPGHEIVFPTSAGETPATAALTADLQNGALNAITFAIGATSITRNESYFFAPSCCHDDGAVHTFMPATVFAAAANTGVDWSQYRIDYYQIYIYSRDYLGETGVMGMNLRIFGGLPEPGTLGLGIGVWGLLFTTTTRRARQ